MPPEGFLGLLSRTCQRNFVGLGCHAFWRRQHRTTLTAKEDHPHPGLAVKVESQSVGKVDSRRQSPHAATTPGPAGLKGHCYQEVCASSLEGLGLECSPSHTPVLVAASQAPLICLGPWRAGKIRSRSLGNPRHVRRVPAAHRQPDHCEGEHWGCAAGCWFVWASKTRGPKGRDSTNLGRT